MGIFREKRILNGKIWIVTPAHKEHAPQTAPGSVAGRVYILFGQTFYVLAILDVIKSDHFVFECFINFHREAVKGKGVHVASVKGI